ncbi:hypothetical protein M0804_007709 [Polistes exclamans]|nr:hypothetical protein M0804_007709 [Polistes exclamans]
MGIVTTTEQQQQQQRQSPWCRSRLVRMQFWPYLMLHMRVTIVQDVYIPIRKAATDNLHAAADDNDGAQRRIKSELRKQRGRQAAP